MGFDRMKLFGSDVGVDLGTAALRLSLRGKGVVLRSPSVLAVEKSSGKVLQVGQEAARMLGRTPANLAALRPIRQGVIWDYDMAVKLLREELRSILPFSTVKPRLLFSVPGSISSVEERAVVQAGLQAGARKVFLMEAPLAAALGAGLPIQEARGHMVVDVGAGTADIAVLSLGGICRSGSLRTAGDAMRDAIARYVRQKHGVLIGESMAEEAKLQVGTLLPEKDRKCEVKGRDLLTGLPRLVTLTEGEMPEALTETARRLVEAIRTVLEQTPPEMVADISSSGITLTGGGSRLRGLAPWVEEQTHIPVFLADDGEDCVIAGMEAALKKLDEMQDGPMNFMRRKQLT